MVLVYRELRHIRPLHTACFLHAFFQYLRYYSMPYDYCRKKEPLDREKINECLQKISMGASVFSASSQLGLCRTTVRRHLQAQQSGKLLPTPGMPPSLPRLLSAEIAVVAYGDGTFIFSSRNDICSYPKSAVVTLLSHPKVDQRSVHHFSDDFSDYRGSLR